MALGDTEVSPGKRLLHRAMGSRFLMGDSQRPALGIRGPQSGALESQASGDGRLNTHPRVRVRS